MFKRAISGIPRPQLEYETLPDAITEPIKISTRQITLLYEGVLDVKRTVLIQKGDKIKTGQRLCLYEPDEAYVISSVTGTVTSISPLMGDFGRSYTAIGVDVAQVEVLDDEFKTCCKDPSLKMAADYLSFTPGRPPLKNLADPEKAIHTIVISGCDTDLLITANQYAVRHKIDAVKKGIELLKKVTDIKNYILAVPDTLMQGYGDMGAQVKGVRSGYPAAHPVFIVKAIFGQVVPAGKRCEDLGVSFFSAEAVASIGTAFYEGRIPVTKMLTLIKKDGSKRLAIARIGTPIGAIIEKFHAPLHEKDRIIMGGPLTGAAVYSVNHPIGPDTHTIMLQDKDQIPLISEYPCINCGDCIRACPAKIQVSMLVRYLEAGHYQQAADQYDLYSCIECGLCSYVCIACIPIFQYIRLAKYELGRAAIGEAGNV